MPIIQTPEIFSQTNADIAIWHIAESEQSLMNMCDNIGVDLDGIQQMRTAKRRIEALCEQLLLHHLLKCTHVVFHLPSGAPYIENLHRNISISHTKQYVAVALCNDNIGIDIEQHTPKVLGVRSRFLSNKEREDIAETNVELNVAAWTAKEALYKAIGVSGIDIANDPAIDAKAIASHCHHYACHYHEREFLATTHSDNDYTMTLVSEKQK